MLAVPPGCAPLEPAAAGACHRLSFGSSPTGCIAPRSWSDTTTSPRSRSLPAHGPRRGRSGTSTGSGASPRAIRVSLQAAVKIGLDVSRSLAPQGPTYGVRQRSDVPAWGQEPRRVFVAVIEQVGCLLGCARRLTSADRDRRRPRESGRPAGRRRERRCQPRGVRAPAAHRIGTGRDGSAWAAVTRGVLTGDDGEVARAAAAMRAMRPALKATVMRVAVVGSRVGMGRGRGAR